MKQYEEVPMEYYQQDLNPSIYGDMGLGYKSVGGSSGLTGDVIIKLFDNLEDLDRFEHILRGEKRVAIIDPDDRRIIRHEWKKVTKPLMNEEGIAFMIQSMDVNTNPKTFGFTTYKKEQIEASLIEYTKRVVKVLLKNYKNYNVNPSDFPRIVGEAVDLKQAIMHKSWDGFLPKILQTIIHKEERSYPEQQMAMQQRKKSWRDYIPSFTGGGPQQF